MGKDVGNGRKRLNETKGNRRAVKANLLYSPKRTTGGAHSKKPEDAGDGENICDRYSDGIWMGIFGTYTLRVDGNGERLRFGTMKRSRMGK